MYVIGMDYHFSSFHESLNSTHDLSEKTNTSFHLYDNLINSGKFGIFFEKNKQTTNNKQRNNPLNDCVRRFVSFRLVSSHIRTLRYLSVKSSPQKRLHANDFEHDISYSVSFTYQQPHKNLAKIFDQSIDDYIVSWMNSLIS